MMYRVFLGFDNMIPERITKKIDNQKQFQVIDYSHKKEYSFANGNPNFIQPKGNFIEIKELEPLNVGEEL